MGKIPDNAKRVFEGVIFDVYQWPQKLFDGTTATFEMAKRADTAIALAITQDNKLVLIDDEQPDKKRNSTLPGGRIDEGEEPLAAVQRELKEETGYTAQEWELWQTIDQFHKVDYKLHFYIAHNAKLTHDQKLDPGERITVKLIDIEDYLNKMVEGRVEGHQLEPIVLRAKLDPTKWQELVNTLTGSNGN